MNLLQKSTLQNFSDWKAQTEVEGGIILINKDEGWTSFDIVRKIKHLLAIKKVGHSGTLDPLASGLMLIAIGKATKLLNDLQNADKQYIGRIKIGATTPSYDRETQETDKVDITFLDENKIYSLLDTFKGNILQFPPVFSALKFEGKRAYKLARKKEDIHLEPRKVQISNFEILEVDFPFVKFKIDVSKGFYVRSFAYDFGKELGYPSYLYSLQRTRIGEFFLENAINIEDIQNLI
jgi:tRNA pseudouridine55 synthase